MRALPLLLVALAAASCVPPSCLPRVFGLPTASPRSEHFATLTVYSPRVDGATNGAGPAGGDLLDRFDIATFITIDGRGGMAVTRSDLLPRSCPTISREDLAAVSHEWQPVLEGIGVPEALFRAVAEPSGEGAAGTLFSLQVGSLTGNRLGILWDGRSRLPEELEPAVMATLGTMCSSSRLARKYLRRDLPREVTRQLACR